MRNLSALLFTVLFSLASFANFNVQTVQLFPTAGDMSQTTDTSQGYKLDHYRLATIQAVFTGSPVGTFTIQVSNDQVNSPKTGDPATNVTNWSTYTAATTAISAAGNFAWILSDASYRWVRLVYTKTSGTGSLTATISVKDEEQ